MTKWTENEIRVAAVVGLVPTRALVFVNIAQLPSSRHSDIIVSGFLYLLKGRDSYFGA